MFHTLKFLLCSFGAVLACSGWEPWWERAVLGALGPVSSGSHIPCCRGWAAAEAVAAPASAGGKRTFYPAFVSQPLQGEEKVLVLPDGGIASTASLWLYERNRLSEPCRASPEECCKRWCSTKLQNKEQGTSMMVPPFLFHLS